MNISIKSITILSAILLFLIFTSEVSAQSALVTCYKDHPSSTLGSVNCVGSWSLNQSQYDDLNPPFNHCTRQTLSGSANFTFGWQEPPGPIFLHGSSSNESANTSSTDNLVQEGSFWISDAIATSTFYTNYVCYVPGYGTRWCHNDMNSANWGGVFRYESTCSGSGDQKGSHAASSGSHQHHL